MAATAAAVEIYDEQICIPLLQPLPLYNDVVRALALYGNHIYSGNGN